MPSPDPPAAVGRCKTLVDLLRLRAAGQPDRRAYAFLVDGEAEGDRLTYGELDRRARAIARALLQSAEPGERVLLLYPPGLEFVAAFFGCLYAGLIAVPAYPSRANRSLRRAEAIVADAGIRLALTSARLPDPAQRAGATGLDRLRWIASEDVPDSEGEPWRRPDIDGSHLALLQYTSGSTADPRGVMVSHANLLHNLSLIREACGHDGQSTFVGWLPLYHDMGLVGNILQPLYIGALSVLMSPASFLQRPLRWLRAITRYRGHTSGGPDFAYDLCARTITAAQRPELDLSTWRVAFNGAEPVRAGTLERFSAAFEPHGFRRDAFFPCYGLAEATLLVSGNARPSPVTLRDFDGEALERHRGLAVAPAAPGARRLVGCGRPLRDQRIVVVDPDTGRACPEGSVGEVWVAGPSVARGYWNQPAATAETFAGALAGDAPGPWLRTGDLGFFSQGELFVTGRIKDLILIRGRNCYPQDVERSAAESHPALRIGGGAAFPVELDGAERLVVVQELERRALSGVDLAAVAQAIRQAVAEQHELEVYAVVLIAPGTLLRTSSGKVRRRACRDAFLNGGLHELAQSRLESLGDGLPPDEESLSREALKALDPGERQEALERFLSRRVVGLLGVQAAEASAGVPLTSLGLDSLRTVALHHQIELALGVVVPVASSLEGATVATLAAEILAGLETAATAGAGRPTGDGHELSHGQRALWFLERLAPGAAAHLISSAIRVQGPLDAGALERSLQKLVDRHAALRTAFSAVDGEPRQAAVPDAVPRLRVQDAAAWSEPHLRAEIEREARLPFDLGSPPLLRAGLFIRSSREHILVLSMHHIVADLWSIDVLLDELRALYPAERAGEDAVLPALACEYADYVEWQHGLLAGPEGERLWDYWRQALAGVPARLNLPTDRPRRPERPGAPAAHLFKLDPRLAQGLRTLARGAGATPYMALLASFQVLLYRYTSQEDFAVASPMVGRSRAGFADVVGYFVNPVVLRARLSEPATFSSFLGQAREVVLGGLRHQDLPFPLLVQRLRSSPGRGHSPLAQAMFVLQTPRRVGAAATFAIGAEGGCVPLADLVLESLPLPQATGLFDLTLAMVEAEHDLRGSFEYDAHLFDPATLERLASHFTALLEGIAADPSCRVSDLPLLRPGEQEHLLAVGRHAWAAADGRDLGVHELFEVQARRTPDAVAVWEHGSGSGLTYGALNRRADRLARHLQAQGVGPEARVGVCLDPSPELIEGMLAVFKAGGTYVPLDPASPAARLRHMLEDADVSLVLTRQALADRLDGHGASLILLDAAGGEIAAGGDAIPPRRPDPDNLAYIVYTSGTTGVPKGVMITHRSLANRMRWEQEALPLSPADRVLQMAPCGFDASVWEVFRAFLAGAAAVVMGAARQHDTRPFLDLISEAGVTTACFVPSLLRACLDQPARERCSLTRVVSAGEPLTAQLQARFLDEVGADLYNFYGPTEVTIDVTCWPCGRDTERAAVPVGRPIAGMHVRVLDERWAPVPPGVLGEVYVGGTGLARGYLNRPELTAERFLPDPFAGSPGARLFRTGDMARWLAGGVLDVCGRRDRQVKLLGVRVEIEEIEAILAQHPAIREAAVALREQPPASDAEPDDPHAAEVKSLVAYVVPDREQAPTPAEIRRYLEQRVPAGMVPASWVLLPALPRTVRGKVDHEALPIPSGSEDAAARLAVPESPVQEIVRGIWASVLGVGDPGVDRHFFDLGGHSLLATQVVSRVRETFGVDLPLSSLFEAPTVREFAASVETAHRRQQGQGAPAAPPSMPASRERPLPVSFAQQRLWFLDQLHPSARAYNSTFALRLTGPLDVAALERALAGITRRHEILRTRFVARDGQPAQVVDLPAEVRLPIVDLTGDDAGGARILALAQADALRPFDLSRGPLFRMALFRLSRAEHVLLVTIHHIVSDGWSIAVLVHELGAMYGGFAAGTEDHLPELPIQYADFACWQRERFSEETLRPFLDYWRAHLAGAAILRLPLDHARPAVERFLGASQAIQLSSALTRDLKALSRRAGVTLFTTLSAAFATLLHRYSGQEDVVVGTDVASRHVPHTEGLIGFFVNQLVLRADLAGDPRFGELLGRMREVCLRAYDHQDLPFDRLVEALRPERDLGRNPVFQVSFSLHNTPQPALDWPRLDVQMLQVDSQVARFDVEVNLAETPEGVTGTWQYNTDCFEAGTMHRLCEHFRIVLEGAAANPECRLSRLPLLTAAERGELLNDGDVHVIAADGLAHQAFEAQAARSPEAVAVTSRDESISYQELNRRANRLARRLERLGVGPDVCVGLLAERGIGFLTAVLATFKAGGAYLPLDPRHPARRHVQVLDQAGAPLLLVARELSPALGTPGERTAVLVLEEALLADEADQDLPSRAAPENLAYVMYTSGSTGVPKGAMVEHRGMMNHLSAKLGALRLGALDVVAQNASQCFDISVWQLLAALLVGGRVDIVDDDTARDPSALLDRVAGSRITILETVPSMLRMILAVPPRTGGPELDALRWLIPTGEELLPELCREWHAAHPGIPLLNAYGPTECSDDVTHHVIDGGLADGVGRVPIGLPIPNVHLRVLDRHLQLSPAGAVGELYVGGVAVGRGYLHDPARTAETFLPDPFSREPGARLYKTGDLSRRLRDGNVEFLGRADHQVKIGGFRIEPGEIEAVLRQHPAVGEAVVAAREESEGARRLVAYVTPGSPDAEDQTSEPGWSQEHVAGWAMVFDETYRGSNARQDARFHGWISSYTGGPIPDAEMRAWADATVERVLALQPTRILELGCGTGALLFRLAPHCRTYLGTDASAAAVGRVQRELLEHGPKLDHVSVLHRPADDFTGIDAGAFDAVLLNSVVQYFPGIDYLLQVLTGAVAAVRPGGFVFVGDVRSLPLCSAFHLSVQLHQAADAMPIAALRERVRRQLAEEKELNVDPGFFAALADHLPGVSHVTVRPKRGRYDNELSRFRYDVVVHAGTPAASTDRVLEMDWPADVSSLEDVARVLAESRPDVLRLRQVPNARLLADFQAAQRVRDPEGIETVGDLRLALRQTPRAGLDPEELWSWNGRLPYRVDVDWSGAAPDGAYDAIFVRHAADPRSAARRAAPTRKPWRAYANNPLHGRFVSKLVPELRRFVQDRLPDYMIPSAFVVLEALPLNRDGKLNRAALPEPGSGRSGLGEEAVAPRTPTEEVLARIWAEVLHLDRVGVEDNFFEIGGHSLVATQTIARVRSAFGVDLTVRELFEGRTVAAVARRIDARLYARTAAARDAAVMSPLARGGAKALSLPGAPAIEKLPEREHYELAVYQLPEWYLHELAPESPFYNTALGNLLLTGPMDVDAFVRAWQTLVERHGIFRTYFGVVDGRPVQKVRARLEMTRAEIYVDRTDCPEDRFHEEVQNLSTAYSGVAFDFLTGPLFCIKLIEFPGDRFVVVFVVHHIVWDEVSTMTLSRELSTLYNAYRAGLEPRLPALHLDYVDFAHWINQAIASGHLEPQRQYWLRQFATVPPPLDLPMDHARPAVQTFNGDEIGQVMSVAMYRAVDDYIKRHDLTLYIYLLAILQTQLFRLTGQRDFVVGTPIANRDDERLEHMLGLFATALPMRCAITDGLTFEELLSRTRETAIEAYDNHVYPSILAIQDINPRMDVSRSRLFSVMYGVQNNKARLAGEMVFDGLAKTYIDGISTADLKTSTFDLTVIVDYVDDSVVVRFNYNSDLFARSTMERMLGQYFFLIEQALRAPATLVAQLALLSEPEAAQILAGFNPVAEPEETTCIQRAFEARAEATPDGIALVDDEGCLTYRQLDAAADRWARHLVARGIGIEDRVGLLLERSPDLVVALLAVLKAGAAFVPLSPDLPVDRLIALVGIGHVRLVLTAGAAAPVELSSAVPVVDVGAAAGAPRLSLPPVDPANLAYVLFTSGTTGASKATELAHRGVTNLLASTQRAYALSAADAVLWITPLSFDAALLEVVWPLSQGARIVVPSPHAAKDPSRLLDLMAAQGVSVLQCVPTMLEALLDSRADGPIRDLPALRLVICGGAPLSRGLRDRFLQAFECRFANHYGPTEVTVDATLFDCRQEVADDVVPIGRPIRNVRCHVLDETLAPRPIGVVGEICVSSPGLARGYTGEPGRTAEQFIPDPFASSPGERLYRTGDRGRYSSDGTLHFVGRLDRQVKIRGHRVELEEIEAHLAAHPAVRRCHVDHARDRLVAFVELQERCTGICHRGDAYRLFTLAQRPDLRKTAERLHADAWPEYFAGDRLLRHYWPQLAVDFSPFQIALSNGDDEVVAVGNSVPIVWDGTPEDLPLGWDDGLERGFLDAERGAACDTLLILTAVVSATARHRGLSTRLLRIFRSLAGAHGLRRVIVPVRPVGKARHPELTVEEWIGKRRSDGFAADDWIRTHERAGATVLKIAAESQHIRAGVDEWAGWSGETFAASGWYRLHDTLQPVWIDLERGHGDYFDPSVWMEHPPPGPEDGGWEHVDTRMLRAHLKRLLPDYMVPDRYRFVSAMPLTEAGKIDARALALAARETTGPRESPAPSNDLQRKIGEIWHAVLKLDGFGIADDFFERGGHSLLAVQMLNKLAEVFGVRISLRDLFKDPTIKGLETLLAPVPAA